MVFQMNSASNASNLYTHTHTTHITQETPVPGSKLKPPFVNPLDDMSPFFQKQYVKGHANDVFAAYGRLLAEICLVLPCQVRQCLLYNCNI